MRRGVKDIITRVGVTTVIVTHDQEEAFDIADRVVIFNRYGTPCPDIDELWVGWYPTCEGLSFSFTLSVNKEVFSHGEEFFLDIRTPFVTESEITHAQSQPLNLATCVKTGRSVQGQH